MISVLNIAYVFSWKLNTEVAIQTCVLLGKGALKIWSKFTGEHPCRSVISIKLLCTTFRKYLWKFLQKQLTIFSRYLFTLLFKAPSEMVDRVFSNSTLAQKMKFSTKNFFNNVTKSGGNCKFDHIYWENP